MKDNNNNFFNTFTGEKLNTYETPFAQFARKKKESSDKFKEEKKAKFMKRYICPKCGQERAMIEGTNILVCKNEDCKGYTKKVDGEEISTPSFYILNMRDASYAQRMFS